MKTLIYYGEFDEQLLRSQLLTAFPTWIQHNGIEVVESYGTSFENGILVLHVPDAAPEQIIADIVLAHDPTATKPIDLASVKTAKLAFLALPEWATMTADEAFSAIEERILSGNSKETIDAWIDTNVTTLATAKTALKLLADETINGREIISRMAMMLMWLRDIVVRKVL